MIALIVGAVVTVGVFAIAVILLMHGRYDSESDRIILISTAIAPIAMVSVMVGYSAWWFTLFILTLLLPDERTNDEH